MSDSQDQKTAKRSAQRARAMLENAPDIWNPTDLQWINDQGIGIPTGARFRAPTTAQELASWGFAGGGAGPDPMIGLDQWLKQNNMTLQQFQEQYGGLPLVFNSDGTATYDPAAQRQSFTYNNPDDGLFHKLAPIALGSLAGLGMTGYLPGTESVFGGAAGAGGAAGSFAAEIPLGTFTNALELGGGLGTDFSLAGAGAGYGGVGTAGTGLSLGAGSTGGLIGTTAADLAAAGGVGSLGSLAGIGAGTGAGLGLNLAGGGLIGETAGSLAGAAGVGLSPVAGTGSGIGSGVSVPAGAAAATGAGAGAQTASSALSGLLEQAGIDVSPGMLDLLGKGLATGLGAYASNQQADSLKGIADQYMGMGAPYRAELQNLNANPSSFYQSPIFQGALQQGSDALSRSLSAKVGNPILNPTALQEMQNFTTRGSLDAYNNRWNQLASAGQLGVSQAAPLATNAAQAGTGTYNALGAGLGSLFGNQRDYAGEFLDLMRQSGGGSGNRYPLP